MTIREPLDVVEAIERGEKVPDHYYAKSDPAFYDSKNLGTGIVIVLLILMVIAGLYFCGCLNDH